jgi:hypothetical protein
MSTLVRATALGCVLLFFTSLLSAQEVGKIEGRVTGTDGQPVQGAQITIVGSRMGTITNESGYYFVNRVPAGVHNIVAQMIGYQRVLVRDHRVLAGQTLTLDFSLRQAAVELEELVVIGEARPLVPRDQVSSKNIVIGDVVDALPVDNVNQLLILQPGVVTADRLGSKGLSIRGGRSGEEAVYVDGILVRNFTEGRSRLTIGTNTLAEVDVLTGGYNAEFGDAQSGIINYVTRSAGHSWGGAVSIDTDNVSPKQWSIGYTRGELSFGGPVTRNLGFFFGGTATGQLYSDNSRAWRAVPIYVARGIDTTIAMSEGNGIREVSVPEFVRFNEGGRQPFGGRDEYTADAKLEYSLGSGSRVFLTGKTSRNQDRGTPRVQLYNLHNQAGTLAKSYSVIAAWTQTFSRTAGSALSLDVKLARLHDWALRNNLAPDRNTADDRPPLGFSLDDFQFLIDRDDLRIDASMVERFLRNNVESILPFTERSDFIRNQEFRMNPYGVASGFPTSGLDGGDAGGLQFAEEKQWQMRVLLDWQLNRRHRLKLGADHFDIDIARFRSNYTNLAFTELWVENPRRTSLFVQNRFDAGDIVLEGGLRYDRFDPNSNFPLTPGYFDLDDPSSFRRAPVRAELSPRLGVAFPVTVNSTFRFSYGHFTQVPDLDEYYRGKNVNYFIYQNTNANDLFARPLRLAKTIAFEFGYRQLLAADFVLDVAAFHRSKLRDVTARKLSWENPARPGVYSYLNTFTNADFGSIRGIDVRLDRRAGIFNGMLAYSYQDAQNTGTDPFTALAAADRRSGNAHVLLGFPPDPPQAMRATEENRRHNLTSYFSFAWPTNHETPVLRGLTLLMTGRVISGFAYTRLNENGELKDGEISSGRMPWQRHIDMRLVRSIRVAGMETHVVVDARNVFDLENRLRVFQTTDGVDSEWYYREQIAAHRATLGGGQVSDRLDLRSRERAGPGVTNDVNLYLLRGAERRFGNGDGIFDGSEQERAFRAAEVYLQGPQDHIGPGRRVRVGLGVAF